jgi:DNA-nicking Smr family endonuclease
MDEWLEKFPPGRDRGKDGAGKASGPPARSRKAGRRDDGIEAVLDLHGMTREEALRSVRDFIRNCARSGRRKALVVHGKGNHSALGAVLPGLVRREVENHPDVADFGPAEPENGGAGALWIFLRQRSR